MYIIEKQHQLIGKEIKNVSLAGPKCLDEKDNFQIIVTNDNGVFIQMLNLGDDDDGYPTVDTDLVFHYFAQNLIANNKLLRERLIYLFNSEKEVLDFAKDALAKVALREKAAAEKAKKVALKEKAADEQSEKHEYERSLKFIEQYKKKNNLA